MSEDKLMTRMTFYVPTYHHDRIRAIAKLRKTPMSRIIGLLVDKELDEDKPFSYDLSLAGDETVEYAYIDQASKLMNFLVKFDRDAGLDTLSMLRYHIGIPDRIEFLGAFNELLVKEMIEPFKPVLRNNQPPVADDYYHYRIAGSGKDRSKKLMSKDAKDFAKFQKLKKKFEGVE